MQMKTIEEIIISKERREKDELFMRNLTCNLTRIHNCLERIETILQDMRRR